MADSLSLTAASTALVIIDLQNGIVARNTEPYAAAEVVERSRKLADAFRAKGSLVVYVHVLLKDLTKLTVDEPMQLPPNLPDSATDIVPEAGMQHGDVLIGKRQWGAFAQTDLEKTLRGRGVDTVVLTGIATNMGVESTLRQGTGLGFNFVVVEDACATHTKEMQDFSFKTIFPRLSRVSTTEKVLQALGS